ncbi:hypothetical protein JS565_02775 [Salmonella enterica subsp. enterica serovar Senftenberg]|nr:hypothetical protein [Salmonella enterica subsp. enterica serovar Senftenberg]
MSIQLMTGKRATGMRQLYRAILSGETSGWRQWTRSGKPRTGWWITGR